MTRGDDLPPCLHGAELALAVWCDRHPGATWKITRRTINDRHDRHHGGWEVSMAVTHQGRRFKIDSLVSYENVRYQNMDQSLGYFFLDRAKVLADHAEYELGIRGNEGGGCTPTRLPNGGV